RARWAVPSTTGPRSPARRRSTSVTRQLMRPRASLAISFPLAPRSGERVGERGPPCYSLLVPRPVETVALTALALVAFAANAILNRMALAGHSIDAASFTAIRLGSGALVLVALVRARAGDLRPLRGRGWRGPLALFAYAAPFSFAYLRLGAAVGAL